MSQTQTLSSRRDYAIAHRGDMQKDVFPFKNTVQEEQVWLWLHLPITITQTRGTGEASVVEWGGKDLFISVAVITNKATA